MLDPGGFPRGWADTLKDDWRYGTTAPRRTQAQVHDRPVSLYSPYFPPFSNITPLASSLGWTPFAASTAVEYFDVQGFGWLFTLTRRRKSTMGRT